jgi:hypothetical protein
MPDLQTILENLRDNVGAELARYIAGTQNPVLNGDNVEITAEDVFNILAKAKTRQAAGLPGSAE